MRQHANRIDAKAAELDEIDSADHPLKVVSARIPPVDPHPLSPRFLCIRRRRCAQEKVFYTVSRIKAFMTSAVCEIRIAP